MLQKQKIALQLFKKNRVVLQSMDMVKLMKLFDKASSKAEECEVKV